MYRRYVSPIFGIIRFVDVLITREAALEIRALGIIGPGGPAWGFLIGRRRGPRFFVEKMLAAGRSDPGSAVRRFRETEGLWPGRVVGLYAVRPGAEIKRAVLGPFFYGKLFIELRFFRKGPAIRPFVVEFDGQFRFEPIPLQPSAERNPR